MFITAQFIISKLWNQSRCRTKDEYIKKIWYIYTMVKYSTIKKNKIMVVILFAGT
jgi:hypothetical protein